MQDLFLVVVATLHRVKFQHSLIQGNNWLIDLCFQYNFDKVKFQALRFHIKAK